MPRSAPGIFGLAGLAALLLALAGCGGEPVHQPPEGSGPALWEVTGSHGERAFLFGTVHSLPPGTQWRTKAIDKAFAASNTLVVEVDLAAERGKIAEIFDRLGRSPGLPPLTSRLPAPQGARLARAMAAKGFSDADFTGMESWAAAITLSQAYEGDDGGEGADLALLDAAGKKRIVELEGAERQLRLFDALPEIEQRDLLAAVAEEALAGEAPGDERFKGWLKGDADMLARETTEGMLADPELREALLVSRNRAWSTRIAGLLGKGKTLFIAVGAAHVVGPDGLAAMLAERGYTVKRVE